MADIDASTEASEAPAASDRPARDPRGTWWGIAIVAGALFAFYVAPYLIRNYRFAVGADAPVYLWWARLAGHDGLSAVGYRPGLPALLLVLKGTLGLSTVQAVAATGTVLAVSLGLAAAAAAAVASSAGRVWTAWGLAGLFAGLFAASLANGYLSSLATGVLFLAAIAVLVARRRLGPVASGALLAAAGVTHPAFFLLAAAVLVAAGAWILWRRPRPRLRGAFGRGSDERRIAVSVLGGTAVAVVGLAATVGIGPGPIADADTSKDAFLRRTGSGGDLAGLYRQRLWSNWWRLLLPAYVPLAAYGAGRGDATAADPAREPFLRRILLAWLAVTAAGVVVGVATGLLPGERFLAFAFALPILGAAGISRLWRRGDAGATERARWARPLAVVAGAAIVVGSFLAWWHPAESIREQDMAAAERAARLIAALPAGTPVVFAVDDPHHAPLSVPRFGNELRGVVPPDRIRDVHLFVGSPLDYGVGRPTRTGDPVHDAMSAQSLRDIRAALTGASEPPLVLALRPMNERWYGVVDGFGHVAAPDVAVFSGPPLPPFHTLRPTPDSGGPTSPWAIVLIAAGALAAVAIAGLGWSRAALGPGLASVAAAPAFGIAALVLAGVAVDRLGVRLTGAVPLVISALVAVGGFVAARIAAGGRQGGGRHGRRVEQEEVGVVEG